MSSLRRILSGAVAAAVATTIFTVPAYADSQSVDTTTLADKCYENSKYGITDICDAMSNLGTIEVDKDNVTSYIVPGSMVGSALVPQALSTVSGSTGISLIGALLTYLNPIYWLGMIIGGSALNNVGGLLSVGSSLPKLGFTYRDTIKQGANELSSRG